MVRCSELTAGAAFVVVVVAVAVAVAVAVIRYLELAVVN